MNQDESARFPDALAPSAFERRVLLAVSGLTPQVVTETLYALAADEHAPFVPTEVHRITSAEGARRAELSLLSDDLGWFHRFGAKTSVGHGAMEEEPSARKRCHEERTPTLLAERKHREEVERFQALTRLSPAMRAAQRFLDAWSDKNRPEPSALLGGLKKGV